MEAEDVKFLASGLTTTQAVDSPQKIATIVEVKDYIEAKYDVTFNSNNIKVENGKISITGSLLSSADWNKVKTNGVKTAPYRITVLNRDKTKKIAKIAMYEDGKAVIEKQ